MKEADLARHLIGDAEMTQEESDKQAADDEAAKAEARKGLARDDYELYEALNLLRGLALLNPSAS